MSRRNFIAMLLGASALGAFPLLAQVSKATDKKEIFAVTMTDEEWKAKLSADAYKVLRHEATEPPRSSPLNDEHRKGVFSCAGCGWPLYASAQKFDSGTGWPSFWQPINNEAVGESTDYKLGAPRTEIHCAHCGGHLGHVFNDGPQPTGKRYCMNGVAMTFKEA